MKPRLLFVDVETSGAIVSTWNLYPTSIPHDNIIKDWYIICAAWKWGDKQSIKATSVLDDPKRFKKDNRDDYHVIKTLRTVFEGADIVVGHNFDKFDLKMFNTRLIYHNLPPLPKLLTIDTLKEAKKVARFTSNRLDYLGKFLIGEGKLDTPKDLWLRAQDGQEDAIREMVRYNKVDVQRLEEVYLRLRAYMKTHPNISDPQTHNCPKCDSPKTKKHMIKMKASGARYQQYQCRNCGAYFSDRKNIELPKTKV